MEEITLERLLNDFRSVLNQINDIVERGDIEQAKEALNQIKELVYNEQNVPLDEGVEQDYDHVLHQLLSQISGVIEVEREETEQELEETQVITVEVIETEITRVEEEIARLRVVESTTAVNREQIADIIERKTRRLELLRQEFERLSSEQENNQSQTVEQVESQIQNDVNDADEEKNRLNAEISDLEGQLQRAARARVEARNIGNESEEAIANAEYSRLVTEISTRRDRISELEGPSVVNSERSESNNPNNRNNNGELDNLQAELERLERERINIENEYYRALEDNRGQENDTTRQLYEELQRKTEEVRMYSVRIIEIMSGNGEREIDNNNPNQESRLDLGEQARLIGDKIFKTARIRSELQERDVSREEFLDFYEAGRQRAHDEMIRLKTNMDDVEREIGSITNSTSGENLYDQLINSDDIQDENERNSEKIRILEEIRQNFIRNGKYEEELRRYGFFDEEITSIEQAERFNTDFFSKFERNAIRILEDFKAEYDEQKENIEIYEQEISRIKDEQRNIEIAQGNLESLEREDSEEKALRERQIRATIFGDSELEQEWNERVKRFYSHKSEGIKRVQTPEGTYNIKYSSIEDYPEYEDDAYFLNLDDYRRYLEITTLYENSGRDIKFMLNILDDATVAEYTEKEAEQEGLGKKWLEEYLADKAEYVSSFHGFTNEHGVKYKNYKTAGSSLKAMKPVKGDLPATTKVGNAIGNTFRFFGIRRPEFSRIDEHGNKVSNTAGALLTLATDALVVGGVTAAALTGPIGWATIGSAYAVRGGVLAGNRIAARSYYKKHKEEIDNNLPTLGNPSKDDKEVARKDYYRRVEGKNRFTSWLKAKNDRFFFKNRARDTEEKIAEERIELSNAVIDARESNAREKANENLDTANRNQQIRQENTRRAIRSQDFYNEVVVDPDSVNLDAALAESARNGALTSHNSGAIGEDVNPTSSVPIGKKYRRNEEEYEQTSDLARIRNSGGTISATAITVEEKYTARQQKQDRINKILTIIGTSAARLGIEYLRTGFTEQQVIESKDPDQVIPGKTTQKPVYRDETVTELDGSKRMSDLQYDDDALNDVWNDPSTIPHEHYVRGNDPIRAFTIRATGADGKIKEVSITQNGYGIIPGRHVYYGVDQDISNLTITEAVDLLKEKMPVQFEEYCKAVGLQGASSEEIAKHAIENGNFFGQTETMAGWEKILPSNLTTTTKQVLDHMETVTSSATTIPGAVHKTVNTVFNPNAVVDTTLQGLVGGAAVGVIDQLHEAAKQTKKVNPGTFEKRTPSLVLSKIARREQEAFNRRRENDTRNQEEHQEHQTTTTPNTETRDSSVENTATDEPIVSNETNRTDNNHEREERPSDDGINPTIVADRNNVRLYRKYQAYARSTDNPLPFDEWKENNNLHRDDER